MGATYSLCINSFDSDEYYTLIRNIVDRLLLEYADEQMLLMNLRESSRKRLFQRCLKSRQFLQLNDTLKKYTTVVNGYLRKLSLFRRFDSILATAEWQYHLFMLEIEVTNRICKEEFKASHTKIALLPHCLSDFRPSCHSVMGDIEKICKSCVKECYINLGSKLMRSFQVMPYISATMDQDKLFKELKRKHQSLAMLGIACVPELVRGMRLCLQFDIPAIGVPLDDNNCARWRGIAYESSFNLN